MKKLFLFYALVFSVCTTYTQPRIISGPMLGPVELRDAKIWVELSPEVKEAVVKYQKTGTTQWQQARYKGTLGNPFNPVTFTLGGLDVNTGYTYEIWINGRPTGKMGTFTTKDLWQWRKPVPDFSFITGSCAYINQPAYDRPGTPYGKDMSIFQTLAREQAAFMLWLGDAWYTREVDYSSEWGLWNRASHDRAEPALQPLLKAMPQFGIWDDHDYGPNDIGKNYILKEASRQVFNSYFCNPSAGENGQGIYTMTSYGDVDLFLTDDRWWRSADAMADSINGKPNPDKKMLGDQQLEWLKNSLLYSTAAFKIIVVGSQVLNPVSPFDKWRDFPAEYQAFMDFLADNKIPGVLLLTGDRHHSEIIKVDRPGAYPLYDITVSPLTSGTHVFGAAEKNNPYRVYGLDQQQNYARFSFAGKTGDRTLTVSFFGVKGEAYGSWSIHEKELKNPQ